MKSSKIQKWGNSMALRIPASMWENGIRVGQAVKISFIDGAIVAKPITKKKYTLDELLAKCDFKKKISAEEKALLNDKRIGMEEI